MLDTYTGKKENIDVGIENNSPILRLSSGGRLQCISNGEYTYVTIKRCFPWSHANGFFSLQDTNEKEVAFIDNIGSLDSKSVKALSKALAIEGFVFEITDIESIEEDFELRNWVVTTQSGSRSFQTPLMAWPRELASGKLLITDVSGDMYYIPAVSELGKKGQKLLWAFLD